MCGVCRNDRQEGNSCSVLWSSLRSVPLVGQFPPDWLITHSAHQWPNEETMLSYTDQIIAQLGSKGPESGLRAACPIILLKFQGGIDGVGAQPP